MYLRGVHGLNDSKALHTDTRLTADQIATVMPLFPWLARWFVGECATPESAGPQSAKG